MPHWDAAKTVEVVERAGRVAPGTDQRGPDATPTLGHPAARSLSPLELLLLVPLIVAAVCAGAIAWAIVLLALIGVFL